MPAKRSTTTKYRKRTTKKSLDSQIRKTIKSLAEKKCNGQELIIAAGDGLEDPTDGMLLYNLGRGDSLNQRDGSEIRTAGLRIEYHLRGSRLIHQQVKIMVLEMTGYASNALDPVAALKKYMFKSLNNASAVPTWGTGINVAEKLTYELNSKYFNVISCKTFDVGHEDDLHYHPSRRIGFYNVPLNKKIEYSSNSVLNLSPTASEMSKQICVVVFGGSTDIGQANNLHGEYNCRLNVKQYFTDY